VTPTVKFPYLRGTWIRPEFDDAGPDVGPPDIDRENAVEPRAGALRRKFDAADQARGVRMMPYRAHADRPAAISQ